jgi:hypothetical protein
MRLLAMRHSASNCFAAVFFLSIMLPRLAAASSAMQASEVFGWVEWTYIEPHHIHVKAKLDSGAKTSSLSAVDIERFERDGDIWMRFRVPISAGDGGTDEAQLIEMERKLEREVLIKRHGGGPSRRPVVEIDVCLGERIITTPVTLTDRSRFNYPLLLGRSALRGHALLDAGRTYIHGANAERCKLATDLNKH